MTLISLYNVYVCELTVKESGREMKKICGGKRVEKEFN